MVKEVETIVYLCPYCGSRHEDETDAESCRDDCAIDRAPDIEENITYSHNCEMCGKIFRKNDEAEKCEQKHIEENDLFYQQYLEVLDREALKKAAEHPEQKKLLEIV